MSVRRLPYALTIGLFALHTLGSAHAIPPDTKVLRQDGRVVRLYGLPLATDSDPATTTDQFVQTFLNDNANALGVNAPQLSLQRAVNISNDKYRVYTYVQQVEGLTVHSTVVRIPVLLGATEKIGNVSIRLVPPPTAPLPADVVTEAQAAGILAQHTDAGVASAFSEATKVVFEAPNGALHRAWRLYAVFDRREHFFFVDTNTGIVVGTIELSNDAEARVTARGYATIGLGPIETSSFTNDPAVAMPGVQVTLFDAQESCPSEVVPASFLVQGYANANGVFSATVAATPVNAVGRLRGPWVRVDNGDGPPALPCNLTYTNPVDGTDQTVLLFASPTVIPGTALWRYLSQVNAFLTIQGVHDWFKILDPAATGIDYQLPCTVNVLDPVQTCNAFAHVGGLNPSLEFLREDNEEGCRNSAYSTFIAHEYGHFIVSRLIPLLPEASFHEGAADTVAGLFYDTPIFAQGFYTNSPYLRRLDDPNVVLNTCAMDPIPEFCVDGCGDPHCEGLALAGAFWDLRQSLGLQTTSQLFADFLEWSTGQMDQGVIFDVLNADDDDADLRNETPNYDEIVEAFKAHGWSDPTCDPTGAVRVAWEGPSGNPELNVHYLLNYNVCPPEVILGATQAGGVPIVRWLVGVDFSSEEAGDLGALTATWNGPPLTQSVRVGTTPQTLCRSVKVVDIPAPNAETGTNVRFQLTRDIEERARVYPATQGAEQGKHGLMQGTIAGNANNLTAKDIAESDTLPGSLTIANTLRNVQLGTLRAGSSVSVELLEGTSNRVDSDMRGTMAVGDILGPLTIEGNFDGTINVGGTIAAPMTFKRNYNGAIQVAKTSRSLITIEGDFTGSFSAFHIWDSIIIHGITDGDICSSDFTPGDPPIRVAHGLFGPNATICGVPVSTTQLPAPLSEPSPVEKNRYISFVPPSTGGLTAIRFKLVDLPEQFADFEGEVRWVGEPSTYTENPAPPGTFKGAALQCEPYYGDWSAVPVLHVYGAEIVPQATYELRAVLGNFASAPLTVSTGKHGDVEAPFAPVPLQPNFQDISAVVAKFAAHPGAIIKARAEMQPNVPYPSNNINFLDISVVVGAFQGHPYGSAGPCICPAQETCPTLDACKRCTTP